MFTVTITDSSREFKGKEAIMLKDTGDAIRLNKAIDEAEDGIVTFVPDAWAVLHIENDNAKEGQDKEYDNYIVLDTEGNKYITGSESFFTSLKDILSEMEGVDEEFGIKCYKVPSNNFSGDFLKCSIV